MNKSTGSLLPFEIGEYRFHWKKAPSGIGILTTEHPSFTLPFHQVCGEGNIRNLAAQTAKDFEAGKTPKEGLFRRTELPVMHKGAAGGVPMRKAISPYSTWATQAHDEGIFLDGPDGPELPEEWRRPGKVVVGPPPCPNRPEHPYAGSVVYQGMLILIENEKGSVREGPPGPDGEPTWRTRMCCHYGEFADTIGTDGDPIDVFVGSDATAPMAYVVHQKVPGTEKHDEDKVMVGFRTAGDAEEMYRKHYDKGGFFGGLTPWPVAELRAYLQSGEADGNRLDSPSRVRALLKGDHLPGGMADTMQPQDFDPAALAEGTRHELEHTTDEQIAREIAMDHLAEDPDYYRSRDMQKARPRLLISRHVLALLLKARKIDPNQLGLFGFGGSVAPATPEPRKVQVEEHHRDVAGKKVPVAAHERVIVPKPADPEGPRKKATWYAHSRINKLKSSISTVQTPEHLHGMHKKLDTLHAYATKWGMGPETHDRLAAARTDLHAHAAAQKIEPKAPPPRVPPQRPEPKNQVGFLPPPGEGWMPVVGSKHGGYHKPKAGGGYAYWYPGEGETQGRAEDRQAVEPVAPVMEEAPIPASMPTVTSISYNDWMAAGASPSASDINRSLKALVWNPGKKGFDAVGGQVQRVVELAKRLRKNGEAAIEWADSRKDAGAQAQPRKSREHGRALLRVAEALEAVTGGQRGGEKTAAPASAPTPAPEPKAAPPKPTYTPPPTRAEIGTVPWLLRRATVLPDGPAKDGFIQELSALQDVYDDKKPNIPGDPNMQGAPRTLHRIIASMDSMLTGPDAHMFDVWPAFDSWKALSAPAPGPRPAWKPGDKAAVGHERRDAGPRVGDIRRRGDHLYMVTSVGRPQRFSDGRSFGYNFDDGYETNVSTRALTAEETEAYHGRKNAATAAKKAEEEARQKKADEEAARLKSYADAGLVRTELMPSAHFGQPTSVERAGGHTLQHYAGIPDPVPHEVIGRGDDSRDFYHVRPEIAAKMAVMEAARNFKRYPTEHTPEKLQEMADKWKYRHHIDAIREIQEHPESEHVQAYLNGLLEGPHPIKNAFGFHFDEAKHRWVKDEEPTPAPEVQPEPAEEDTADDAAPEAPPLEDVAGDDYTKDIPTDLARRAWAGISHSPERRGDQAISDYAAHLTAAKERFEAAATTPEGKAQVAGLFKEYRDGYRKHVATWLAAQSRLMSPMITGPARFPVERMRKIGDTADARSRELQEWSSRTQARIVKTITTKPKTAEEIASAASAKQTHSFDGGQIVYNPGEERLQVLFDDKPDAEMRAKLKSAGFIFSFKNTAWQRKLTDNAVYSTRRLLPGAETIPLWSASAKAQPAANEGAAPEPAPAAPPAADKTHQQYQKRIDAVKALLDKPAGMSAVDHQLALSRAMAELEQEEMKAVRHPDMKEDATAAVDRGRDILAAYSAPVPTQQAPAAATQQEIADVRALADDLRKHPQEAAFGGKIDRMMGAMGDTPTSAQLDEIRTAITAERARLNELHTVITGESLEKKPRKERTIFDDDKRAKNRILKRVKAAGSLLDAPSPELARNTREYLDQLRSALDDVQTGDHPETRDVATAMAARLRAKIDTEQQWLEEKVRLRATHGIVPTPAPSSGFDKELRLFIGQNQVERERRFREEQQAANAPTDVKPGAEDTLRKATLAHQIPALQRLLRSTP